MEKTVDSQKTAALAAEVAKFNATHKQVALAKFNEQRGAHFANIVRLNGPETMLLLNSFDRQLTSDVLNHMSSIVNEANFDIVDMARQYIAQMSYNPLQDSHGLDLSQAMLLQGGTNFYSEAMKSALERQGIEFIELQLGKGEHIAGLPLPDPSGSMHYEGLSASSADLKKTLVALGCEVIEIPEGDGELIGGLPTVEESTMEAFRQAQGAQAPSFVTIPMPGSDSPAM